MPEYGKLKVTELKEELNKRGLPKSGLKAELVKRLVDADKQAESVGPAVEKARGRGAIEQPEEGATVTHDTGPPAASEAAASGAKNEQQQGKSTGESVPITQSAEQETLEADKETESTDNQAVVTESQSDAPKTSRNLAEEEADSNILPGNLTQFDTAQTSEKTQLPTPIETQSEQTHVPPDLSAVSTQGSLTTEEIIEDSKKRKRRSQSPTPSSAAIKEKKLKADSTRPNVELPEDKGDQVNGHEGANEAPIVGAYDADLIKNVQQLDPPERVDVEAAPQNPDAKFEAEIPHEHGVLDGLAVLRAPGEEGGSSACGPIGGTDVSNTQPDSETTTFASTRLRPSSPSDTRFKKLFNTTTGPIATSVDAAVSTDEERAITPSVHPATSALYIRDLMRPLNPQTVKSHLASLANPPNASPSPDIITAFHLDTIRTHCLIGFSSTSAASRVRSSLHDRVWPNERDRRALWVDFVPEEKLQKWIEIEQESAGGRGQAMKRWEIVYENEDGGVKAYLQEVGSNSGGLRTAQAKGQGVQGAPSGPRAAVPVIPPRDDQAKGFQALDDLFKSTAAKPKLYFQPVARGVVEKRLSLLDAGRGGGRSDEARRYTFEDDILVDNGPEFGMRGRGGYRGGRGGGYEGGGYRGRGGGYRGRGDGYRGSGGDSYRRGGY